ncbi:orotidine 5'-phosphate decarboxylase [Candidatus Epulonipiscium fishelsonii]|uniref:Orotidine 5'-phosphate decarboxylase n=1 Tax=Candidatus Epulonipiscium fishelsonii TaxID=77094 RepID=A0ACC8XAV1_9FIRM|nr:orotidine 5'-phosphate decarboxylase [Epulopiscium sp. SCG-B05WGA-EpuloA1]ONI39464.1 orotidine 5'-phosphate decarboxylase [Epulopiscium sp. SCG-B11WGA-EpuloA1]
MDKLIEKIELMKNPTVVGLDPTLGIVPSFLKEQYLAKDMIPTENDYSLAVAKMFFDFNKQIIDNIYDIVPAIKPQIAMYEQFGTNGISAYINTCHYAKIKGMIVIGDIKRGDIASTAESYASHIKGTVINGKEFDFWKEDFVTVNPYLGVDGIQPFIDACNEKDKGIFILTKTSNPSSADLQDLLVDGEPLYYKTACLVSKWGELAMGKKGYSKVGAVVGATYPEQGVELRNRMPHTFFLVPGYGAQGATGKDLKGFFDQHGGGCIVNSSRGIIAAYKNDKECSEKDFAAAARKAAIAMKKDLEQRF